MDPRTQLIQSNEIEPKLNRMFADNSQKHTLLTLLLLEEEKNFKNISTKKYPIDKPIERATKKSIRQFMSHCLYPVDLEVLANMSSLKAILRSVDRDNGSYVAAYIKASGQILPTYPNVPDHKDKCIEFFAKFYKSLLFGMYRDQAHIVNDTLLIDMSILDVEFTINTPLVPAYGKKRKELCSIYSSSTHVTSVIDNIDESIITELQLHPQFIIHALSVRTAGNADIANSYVFTHLKQEVDADNYLSEDAKQLVSKVDSL